MKSDYDAYEDDCCTLECSHEWIICQEKSGKPGYFMYCKYCGMEYQKYNIIVSDPNCRG